MSSSVEARCLVIDFVSDLANVVPDPADWGPHLLLLIKRLESEAYELDRPDALQTVFAQLRNEITVTLQIPSR